MTEEELKKYLMKDVKVRFKEGKEDCGVLLYSEVLSGYVLRRYDGTVLRVSVGGEGEVTPIEDGKAGKFLDAFMKYEDLFDEDFGLGDLLHACLSFMYGMFYLSDVLSALSPKDAEEWSRTAFEKGADEADGRLGRGSR